MTQLKKEGGRAGGGEGDKYRATSCLTPWLKDQYSGFLISDCRSPEAGRR